MPKLSLGDFQSNRTVHLVTLVLVSAVVALGLHLTYLPWWCGDSSMYARPAWQIYHGTFAGYPGYRTPGYPLFLLACEGFRPADKTLMTPLSGEIVTWAQSLLHLAMAPLIYFSMERLLIRPWINFSLALLFALLVGVAQFQMYLLSESLCCFCLVLATCLATVAIDRFRHEQPSAIVALLAGFAFGAAVLVRPNIIFPWIFFIGAVPAFALWRKMRRRPIEIARMMLQVSRPCFAGGALLIIGWLFVNYENTGLITLSTMIDVTRVSTAYNLFDRVHPEDKVLGDIMVKYHLQTEHDDLQKKIYFFSALPEIRAHASQMPLPDAATGASALHTVQYLGHVSRYLLWENPGVWAQNSALDFSQTFDFRYPQTAPGVLTDPVSLLRTPVVINVTGWRIFSTLNKLQAWLILPLYLLTFAAAPMALAKTLAAPNLPAALVPLTVTALAFGTLICMVAPSLLAAYFTRFSVPVLPLFVICSGYVVEALISHRQKNFR